MKFSGLSLSGEGRSCSFFARADAESAEVVVAEEERDVEAEETEDKFPRQTRVKLGDVTGVMSSTYCTLWKKIVNISILATDDAVNRIYRKYGLHVELTEYRDDNVQLFVLI